MSPVSKKPKKLAVRYVRPAGEEEIKPVSQNLKASEPSKPSRTRTPAPSLNLYRRIAVGFVVCVGLLLVAVLYVSSVSATIHVTPVKETITSEFLSDVVKTPTTASEVRGKVVTATVGKNGTYKPGGEGSKEVEEKAVGVVTIVNTSSRNQPLVATTRLLTPSGILFRIDSTVTAPAGGTVDVAAHADLSGVSGEIGPTRMTIPGLSESLQASIYAENKTAFTGGMRRISVVSQQDIDASALTLRTALEEDAKNALRDSVGEIFSGEAFIFEVVEQTSSIASGTEADSYTLSMNISAVGIFYDRESLSKIATRKLYEQVKQGSTFASLNAKDVQVGVDNVDSDSGNASLHVYLDGQVVASQTSDALEPGRFSGMTLEEVKSLLIKEKVATDVSIDFSPFWIKSVPRLRDHIYVEIE